MHNCGIVKTYITLIGGISMKCSKCGEECRDNQAFCIKCGNPIQVVPDFNLIEAELANSIGALLDEDNNSSSSKDDFEEEIISEPNDMKTRKFDGNLAMDIKLMDVNRSEKVVFSANQVENNFENTGKIKEAALEEKDDEFYDNKGKKKRIVIFTVIAVLAFGLILGGTLFLISIFSKQNDYNKATFESSYAQAETYVTELNYKGAVEQLKIALDKATNADEKLKARVYLDQVYSNMTGVESDILSNLLEITKIKPDDATYFNRVAKIYLDNKEYDKLSDFLNSVTNDDVFAALSEYTVDEPTTETATGDYSEYLSLKFTAPEGCKIYYTIHKVASMQDITEYTAPSVDDELYINSIELKEEAIFVVQAVAINEKGIKSRTAEYRYAIELGIPASPVITPASGQFTEHTQITIKAEEGTTIYYTIDDDKISEESTVYTEPFDMPVGVHIIRAMIVDKYGVASKVTVESYTLKLAQNFKPAQGKEAVIQQLITDGVVTGAAMETPEGGTASVNYKETKDINNAGYYIYTIELRDADGITIGDMFYAFNYNDGKSYKVDMVNGSYIIVGLEEP